MISGFIYKIIRAALFVYVALIGLMVWAQPYLLFFPDKTAYTFEDVRVTSFKEATVTTHDNLLLRGWYAPAAAGHKTILFFHGNASSWQTRAPDFEILAKQGFGVLLAGYRGYGGNPGEPDEAGFYKDAQSWLGYLTATQKIAAASIVIYGESLGTGVAVDLATRTKGLGGLVLEAPYTSIPDVAAHHYPFVPAIKLLARYKFDSLGKIEDLAAPLLVLLAGHDVVVPPAIGRALYDAAPRPKTLRVYPEAAHENMRRMGALADVAAFLAPPAP